MSNIDQLQHRAAWTPQVLSEAEESWIYHWTDDDIAELDQALRQVSRDGLTVPRIAKEQFPIPGVMSRLAPFRHELDLGLGVLYLKGFPIERYTKDEASVIFWGLGMHFGRPWEQNVRGHLLGDVINEGKSLDDPSARGYQTTATLEMHTDGADVVGLLCLKQAPEGGESQIVSALSVYNQLAATNPGALQRLLDTEWCMDWRGEEAPGSPPYHRGAIYERTSHGVTCLALTGYIYSAQRYEAVPRLSDADREAIEAFRKASEDPALVLRFRQSAGDMQFLNNHFHMHGRSTYVDAEDPRERRHLRRLWLESEAWSGCRPRAMQEILANARQYWARPDSTVQMWDRR